MRELELADVLPEEIGFHFRDFIAIMQSCSYQPCLHDEEPDCAVAAAVERGEIHHDRYESYLRILDELREYEEARAWMSTRCGCWSSPACGTSWRGCAQVPRAHDACVRSRFLTEREALDALLDLAGGVPDDPGVRLQRCRRSISRRSTR